MRNCEACIKHFHICPPGHLEEDGFRLPDGADFATQGGMDLRCSYYIQQAREALEKWAESEPAPQNIVVE